jgi:hypothetical protein
VPSRQGVNEKLTSRQGGGEQDKLTSRQCGNEQEKLASRQGGGGQEKARVGSSVSDDSGRESDVKTSPFRYRDSGNSSLGRKRILLKISVQVLSLCLVLILAFYEGLKF